MSLTTRQKKARLQGISASEIAALAGLSKWKAPIQIYAEKVSGEHEEVDTYTADLGTEMEEPLARVYAKREKVFLSRVDTLVHPTKPFALATPDRAVYLDKTGRGDARLLKKDVRDAVKLLEVKSTNWRMRRLWGEPGTDEIPTEYLCQVQWQMGVTGLRTVDVFVDFDKTEGHIYTVTFREGLFESLCEVAERFMIDHVGAGVPPPPDASEAYADHLNLYFPRQTGDRAKDLIAVEEVSNPEVYAAVRMLSLTQVADARLKHMKNLAKNIVAKEIGHHSGIAGSWGKITYLTNKPSTKTDWKAVATDAMNVAGLCVESIPEAEAREVITKRLQGLVADHTKVVNGARVMRRTFKEGESLDFGALELLPMEMPKLIPGATKLPDEKAVDAESSNAGDVPDFGGAVTSE